MTSNASVAEFSLPRRHTSNRKNPVLWIASHAAHHWTLGLLVIIGAFSNAGLAGLAPIYIGQAFNAILETPPQANQLGRLALLLLGTQLLRALLHWVRNISAGLMSQRVERDIRDELYLSLLGKSMTFHNLQPVGDTMARATNDVREVNFLFNPGLNLVIGSAIFLFVPLFVAPRYHPSLVLVPCLYIIAYVVALGHYLHELDPITTNIRTAFGRLNTRLSEALDGIETVKGMAQEKGEIERFTINAKRLRDAAVRQGDVEARFLPLLILAFAEAGGFLHATLLFRQGIIDLGSVIAYFTLIQLLGFPTFTSLWAYSQISLGVSAGRRILELMNRENDLDQNIAGVRGNIRGEVEFRDVHFAYPGHQPALEGVTFKVKQGQTVAIVGQTGSGKTTLVKLINRIYDATSGQVLIDGVDARDWNLESLRRSVSIIEQDIFLWSRSIAENIAFGRPGATQADIVRAAESAQALEFIESFEDGFETIIGERGVTLSGGQRQRIALARAFLTDPKILILDDSTSAIDSKTEDRIQRAIYAAAQGRTTFLITHRLSQIRWADLIIVLRQGKVAATGSHDELMESSESYRRIFSD
jgi:ATP-binding cassette, subfamily B, bacterial